MSVAKLAGSSGWIEEMKYVTNMHKEAKNMGGVYHCFESILMGVWILYVTVVMIN